LGYVLSEKPKNQILKRKSDYLNNIIAKLAGRAAEDIFFGDVSSGCSNDLEQATKTAKNLVYSFGFGETMGLIRQPEKKVDEGTRTQANIEIKEILDDCYEKAKTTLEENRGLFDKVLDYLMSKGTITGEEFTDLVKE
jgi:cell division protease FtsH